MGRPHLTRLGYRSTRLRHGQPGPPGQVGLADGTVPPGVARCKNREGFLVPRLPLRDPGGTRQRLRVDHQVFSRAQRTRGEQPVQV